MGELFTQCNDGTMTSTRQHEEHDIFDDVPENGSRAGTHRALDAPVPRATRGIVLLIAAGAAALSVGAVAYLVGVNPHEREAVANASSSPSTEQSAQASDSVAPDSTVQVGVYNAASVNGAAGKAAQQVTDAGWTVASIDNWGVAANDSVVYYADVDRQQAQALADELNIKQVVEDDAVSYPLVVVIGTDIAGGPTAEPAQPAPAGQPPAQEPAAPAPVQPEPAPAQPEPAQPAPAEPAPVGPVPAEPAPVQQPPAQPYVPPAADPYSAGV